MADVEEKFGQPKEVHAPQAGLEPAYPMKATPGIHIHYWAIYKRFGVTVIYNSPAATDKDATIYAILISK